METDAESHSQNLAKVWEIVLKMGEEGLKDLKWVKYTTRKRTKNQQTWTCMDSLRLNQILGSLHGFKPGLLYICYNCIACCFCGNPTRGNGDVCDSIAWFLGYLSSYWVSLSSINIRVVPTLIET